jgi:hypothetical protein
MNAGRTRGKCVAMSIEEEPTFQPTRVRVQYG